MLIGNIICLLSLLTSSRTILNPSLNWVGITGWQCIHIVLLWLWDQKIDKWYQLQRNATSKLAKFSTRKPARVTLDFHVCWICFICLLIFPRRPGHRSRRVFPPALILAKTMYHLTGKNEKEKTSENSSQIMLPKTPIFHHANGGNPKHVHFIVDLKTPLEMERKSSFYAQYLRCSKIEAKIQFLELGYNTDIQCLLCNLVWTSLVLPRTTTESGFLV